MKWIRCMVAALLWFLGSTNAFPYERDTHRQISKSTVENSLLSAPVDNILLDLGLSPDIGRNSSQKFPNSQGEEKSIVELMQDGADFEDNLSITLPRPLHHFYDPINDESLHHPLLNLAGGTHASPDWALEDTGQIAVQEYSYQDAMDAFYLALTSPTEVERNQQWGKVFETLGHVIHHIQDMAQPEHVRNDLHCDEFWGCGVPLALIGIYDPSLFEGYSKRVFRDGIPAELVDYPAVTFPNARDFWTTRVTDPVVVNRRGLADFTDRNFVSKDTNFELKNGAVSGSSRYDLPVPSGTNIEDLATLDPRGSEICQALNQKGPIDLPPGSPCEVEFIENAVTDSYDPAKSGANKRATSLSLLDQYLDKYNVDEVLAGDGDTFHVLDVDRLVTINEYNIDEAHEFLIPRAVAYGEGLIDHFFRGRISLVKDGGNDDWTITNLSNGDMRGTFTLVSESNGVRQSIVGAVWDAATQMAGGVLTAGDGMSVSVSLPQSYDRLVLAFHGSIGVETNVESVAGYVYGAGWSVPVMIQDNSLARSVAVNASGNVVASWIAGNEVFTNNYHLDGGWDTPHAVYSGDGLVNGMGGRSCAVGGSGGLKISENGDAALCFIDGSDSLHSNVFCSLYSEASGWSYATQVSALGNARVQDRVETLALALDDVGDLLVLWEQSSFDPPDFNDFRAVSKEYHADTGWSAEKLVVGGGDPQDLVWLDVNNNTEAIASFHNNSSAPYKAGYRSADGSWTIFTLPPLTNVQFVCETVIDAMGNAMVVWRQGEAVGSSMRSGYYAKAAGWIDIRQFVFPEYLQIDFDGLGNALAIWSAGSSSAVSSSRYGPDSGWDPAVTISPGQAPGVISGVDVAVDAVGNAWAVWILDDNGHKSVWVSRYTANH